MLIAIGDWPCFIIASFLWMWHPGPLLSTSSQTEGSLEDLVRKGHPSGWQSYVPGKQRLIIPRHVKDDRLLQLCKVCEGDPRLSCLKETTSAYCYFELFPVMKAIIALSPEAALASARLFVFSFTRQSLALCLFFGRRLHFTLNLPGFNFDS